MVGAANRVGLGTEHDGNEGAEQVTQQIRARLSQLPSCSSSIRAG
jgi:hypothetical protein